MPISITLTNDMLLFEQGAAIMYQSEPWITLKRNFNHCIQSFLGEFKEVYIAKENDQLLGFIIVQMAGTFKGYIQSIAITENARGKGIGTTLIAFAEKRILSVSPNIFICVSSFNIKAQHWYFKLGYEKIGVLKDFIVKDYDEILLRKTIGPLSNFGL